MSAFLPWKIDEAPDLPLAVIEDTADGLGVCEIGARTPENLRRAHAIAAVPDLIAALRTIAGLTYCYQDAAAAIGLARGALAQAGVEP